ncbi:ergosterol biosynthesis ERG4/ERG24 [Cercophora newfieldiana]|uniref:7-dehydrocholesterol reductase n=1 Tax=Cercophora newfieldiana TaxID=92897 RepID=A0AA40CMT5_9PEZI|nr:ergosterol biosynthesis ERG4/ERG24 [Cercophora newfieldiana]
MWGRQGAGRSWLGSLFASLPVVLGPIGSVVVFIILAAFEGSLCSFVTAVAKEGLYTIFAKYRPQLTARGVFAVAGWIGWQALLFQYLPGKIRTGQVTPAGHILAYRMNGLSAWFVTHLVWIALCWLGILDPAFIPRNWSGLVAAMNLGGVLVAAFAFVKAYASPTHPDDRKFSGSSIYDFYMGIEFNPRFGRDFDFKLFNNGHLGMMVWTLIDFSNMAYQYQTLGHVKPSLILLTILQTIYVLDFFVNEAWYLATIDIEHDHYGFYLAWGCICFLPTMYTIQAQYMGLYPTSPSSAYLTMVFAIGLAGYAVFRSVNNQKDRARRLGPGHQCYIWGKPAEFIVAPYTTSNGTQRTNLLLCSGWWGWSRHANYVGDLVFSYSTCALVGLGSGAVVWTYAIFMTILLVHRCKRDEKRLEGKYGDAWAEYCRRVPWRLVPGIW